MGNVKTVKLMVKPTHRCNLNCTYCYDKQVKIKEDMSLELVEEICKFATASTDGDITWIWHGGEPLMMPLEFYIEAHKILMKYNITTVSMQSNATLLTKEHIEAFRSFKWNIGFSFDGELHSNTRGDDGRALENILMYRKMGYNPSIIKVVDSTNISSFYSDYDYFKQLGIINMQFSRVFISPTAELIGDDIIDEYMSQFAKVFDKWVNDENPLVIRNFDEYIGFLVGGNGYLCAYKGECIYQYMNINPIGQLTPCDRWYPDEFTYGNLKDFKNVEDVRLNSKAFAMNVAIQTERLSNCKATCEIFSLCNGGCNANAVGVSGGSEPDKLDCALRKKELYHIFNYLKDINIEDIKNPNLQKMLIRYGFRNMDVIGGETL